MGAIKHVIAHYRCHHNQLRPSMHVCLYVPVWRVYMRVSTAGIAPVEAAAALLMALSSGQKVPASAADFATFGLKNAYINGGGS